MKAALLLSIVTLTLAACGGKPKYDDAMLEKYPKCYHINYKIYAKCIKKNEAGDAVTALELENSAYPGQYN